MSKKKARISIKKFIMKWRFRLDQARGIFALATFAALLAVGYVDYLSFFARQGFWGIVELSIILLVVFMTVGYLYDRVFRLWNETAMVAIERNPYSYVPGPKELVINMGINSSLLLLLFRIAEKAGISISEEEELLRKLLATYYSLTPETEDFEETTKELKNISQELHRKFLQKNDSLNQKSKE